MKNITWNEVMDNAEAVALQDIEIDEVSGGIAPLVVIAIVGGSFGAGYKFGSDYANNRNRNNGPVRRR